MSNKRGNKATSNPQNIRTIDTKHAELLERFQKIENEIIPQLQKEKETLKLSVNTLNENQLDDFMLIKDKIVEINKQIKLLTRERKTYLLDNSKHIFDYFEQLGAYCMAHNYVYGTKIQSGIILMCTKDFLFQKFEVSGREFVRYQHAFLKKVDQYHQNCTQAKEGQDTKNDEKV